MAKLQRPFGDGQQSAVCGASDAPWGLAWAASCCCLRSFPDALVPMPTADFTVTPLTDPTPLYRLRDGLHAADLLIVALVHLDLFSWIASQGPGGTSEEAIVDHFKMDPRMTDVLVTLFRAQGLLRGSPGSSLHLTPLAEEHMVSRSPLCLQPYFAPLHNRPGVVDLVEIMRTGKPVLWGGQQAAQNDWHSAMEDEGFAERFTAVMDCRGALLGPAAARAVDLASTTRLLDVAGGSGIYACAFAAHHPHLAATVLEKPPVDALAARLIAKRGFSDRVTVVAADMMNEPLPAGYDAHLWSNVLHDWDVPEVLQLIRASFDALPPDGLFIMHDAFLNDAKDGPLHVAEYSVTLAHATQGRCYGTGEMRDWLIAAGFTQVAHRDTTAARGVLTARKPATAAPLNSL